MVDGTEAHVSADGDVATEPAAVVRELRKVRQRKRLVSLEWFELAYKVYVAGIIVVGAVVALSHLVGDDRLSDTQLADLRHHAPALVGLALALAIGLGARSGARGGPISVESADVQHLLLGPVARRDVLLRPAVQQVRLAVFAGGSAGAVAGQLLARRVGDPLMPWAASGAVAGATIAVAFVAAGLLAHALHVRQWQASLVAGACLAAQAVSIPDRWDLRGPFDSVGSLVLWPMRVHVVDVVTPLLVAAAAALGLVLLNRCSVDALARRGALVSQLRFAVTVRDLRTVVLLRRQLANEQHRRRPWFRIRAGARFTVATRDARSIARFPLSRLVRMTLLTAVAAAGQVAAYRGTTPAVVVSGLAALVLGLECLEPFAQELDQPDRSEGVPRERGWLLVRHLPVPAAVASAFALAGAAGVIALTRTRLAWELSLVLALPVVLSGAAGAVLNIMGGIPEPVTPGSASDLLPPEVAGMREMFRTIRPLVVAVLGSLPVLGAREAAKAGDQPLPPAIQLSVAVGLVVAGVAWWARKRDEMRAKMRMWWSAGDAEWRARHDAKAGRVVPAAGSPTSAAPSKAATKGAAAPTTTKNSRPTRPGRSL